jgi:hypothetical protein
MAGAPSKSDLLMVYLIILKKDILNADIDDSLHKKKMYGNY